MPALLLTWRFEMGGRSGSGNEPTRMVSRFRLDRVHGDVAGRPCAFFTPYRDFRALLLCDPFHFAAAAVVYADSIVTAGRPRRGGVAFR